MFSNPGAKLMIGSVDADLHVEAQYNPNQLQFAKQASWSPGKWLDGALAEHENLGYQFTGAQPRTLTLELVFDGFEDNASVEYTIDTLELLASIRDPEATDSAWLRPHLCVVTWGNGMGRKFPCVIESVQSKFTMFGADGTPLRAVATVTLKEADVVGIKKAEGVGKR